MPVHNPKTMKLGEDGQWRYFRNGKNLGRCEVRSCAFCGTEFVTYPSHKATTCSRPCRRYLQLQDPEFVQRWRGSIIGQKGEDSARWKGGRQMVRGYVHIWRPDHPSLKGTKRIYVAEHRLVMEEMLGRLLKRSERVHHKNGIKTDNRPENLELWEFGHPPGQRVEEHEPHCPTCTCFKHKQRRFAS